MDVPGGFQVERPAVLIPWDVAERDLETLFPDPLRHVTKGYYTLPCTSLHGLEHVLGLHFDDAGLTYLEFFLAKGHNPKRQFPIWQRHLEAAFGSPTNTKRGDEGFDDHTWELDEATVYHYVIERFSLEEHISIAPNTSRP